MCAGQVHANIPYKVGRKLDKWPLIMASFALGKSHLENSTGVENLLLSKTSGLVFPTTKICS